MSPFPLGPSRHHELCINDAETLACSAFYERGRQHMTRLGSAFRGVIDTVTDPFSTNVTDLPDARRAALWCASVLRGQSLRYINPERCCLIRQQGAPVVPSGDEL